MYLISSTFSVYIYLTIIFSYYTQNIGIKAIRLNSVLETRDYLHSHTPITNYTAVDPMFGSNKDLHLLAAVLHEKNMYLLMDIPLTSKTNPNLGMSTRK